MSLRLTRSQFLAALGTGAAVLAFEPRHLLAGAVRHPAKPGLNLYTFQALVGSAFRLRERGGAARDLVLADVKPHAASPRTEQFSLRFVSTGGHALGEGTFPIFHPALGRFDIFIMPGQAGPNDRRDVYRADFNLIL